MAGTETDHFADHRPFDWFASGSLEDVLTGKTVEVDLVGPPGGEAYAQFPSGGRFRLSETARVLSRPYSVPRPEGGFRGLQSFSEGQVRALYPFALVLACLDGNAFVNHQDPDSDLVRQYVPEAFAVLDMNGCVTLSDDGASFRSDRPESPAGGDGAISG